MTGNTVIKGRAGRRARGGLLRANLSRVEALIIEARKAAPGKRTAGRPRKGDEWIAQTAHRTPKELSLLALDSILESAMRKKPSRRLRAAIDLGSAVLDWDAARNDTAQDALAASVGFQVATVLSDAGLIEDLKPPLRAVRDKTPVTLTPVALASVENLLDAAPAVALTEPATGAAYIKRGVKSLTDAPAPLAPVEQTLALIRATQWAINPHMLAVLKRMYQGRRDKLKASDRAALHTATRQKAPFYLDGHFDFRGRFYQDGLRGLQWTSASDFARSLLQFADGYPINHIEGLPFLKLHITSLWGQGVDKLPDAQRWAWFDEHEADILGCCADPFKRGAFWRKPKDRYRFLAACFAYRDALQGLPVHLPCSYDVTCSGIGIYATLLRDADLARLVGILPSPDGKPMDFYKTVGDACGVSRKAAKKIIKGTMYGAGEGSTRPVNAIRKAMWDLMPEARRMFDWLRASQDRADVLTWTLPDGFLAVNDYRQVDTVTLECYAGRRRIQEKYNVKRRDFDKAAAVRAIAANFVHSWDAAYLRAVVRLGAVMGIPAWGLAHDCFSVHAAFAQPLVTRGLQWALRDVFGPDRLAALGWDGAPGIRGPLDWTIGNIVG
jgi:DNA-dependent RNA polymerase